MAKNYTIIILACVIALLIGGTVGYLAMPEKVRTETKTVISPPEIQVHEIEVIKEVPLSVQDTFLKPAIDDFLDEVNDDDNLVYCDGEEFDEDQIKVKSTPRDYQISIEKDRTEVDFNIKLKYLDKDVQEKCYEDFDVEVVYEDGEKPQVSY